jgi:hypothetical protein
LHRLRQWSASAFWLVVGTRLACWAAVLVALLWDPLRSGFPPFRAYGARSDFVFGAFAQWDAGWFLRIAAHGYDVKQSASFFPLYPLLVAGLGFVLRSDLVAGVVISLLSAGLAAAAVVRIARRLAGDAVARESVLLLALYPIGFVLTAVYSDGLFLALAAWAFLAAVDGRAVPAGLLGALAVLTRPTGVALVPALVMLVWPRRRDSVRPAALLLVPAALAGYCVYLHEHYGDAFAFVHSEGSFEQGLAQIVRHLPAASGAPGGFGKPEQFAIWNVVQLLLLVAACWLTWVCWRRVSRAAAVYSAATILLLLSAPADVVPLVSVPRFLLGDFPLFIALAVVTSGRPRLRTAVVSSFAALGLVAAVGFAHGTWIS